ncbi:NERD domain-containing protein [Bacillus sp. HMF5848]|uniref:nuclease-related domain-containing protein n=1 Tax=Bacillus sp. HMF5848 TaxID=2495421 RepID=UPI000F77A602|nr:nuclease-related domain-containing protein [Bacillus sp. HMF5848]RSK28629.1 NERD domain-containing protein [Bacillus sp. HMF5848]
MIVKKLDPILREVDEAIKRCLKAEVDSIGRIQAGDWGENEFEYYARLIDSDEIRIFHHIRIAYRGFAFQIDCLILTPHFAIIIEIKNLKGVLTISNEQLIQNVDGRQSRVPNPIAQVKTQSFHFMRWLEEHGIESYPIINLVVSTNRRAIFEFVEPCEEARQMYVHADNFPLKFRMLEIQNPANLTQSNLNELSKTILASHKPKYNNTLEKYGLTEDDFVFELKCQACGFHLMTYKKGAWHCDRCGETCKDCHVQLIRDYLLILGRGISLKECRQLFGIQSRNILRNLLRKMNLKLVGNRKSARYFLSKK